MFKQILLHRDVTASPVRGDVILKDGREHKVIALTRLHHSNGPIYSVTCRVTPPASPLYQVVNYSLKHWRQLVSDGVCILEE